MTICQNCGNTNTPESQYCRLCGNVLATPKPKQSRDYNGQAPRPYMWKTDEYQTQTEPRPATSPAILTPSPEVTGYGVSPAPYSSAEMFSGSYRCPNCATQFLPRVERRVSTAGWIVFSVLLVFIFPLFWIGLLIKEDVHVCPSCSAKIR
jgi:DNA-directed RNA polymerase subunit RPC12/RpoP/ribosomal protein L40E